MVRAPMEDQEAVAGTGVTYSLGKVTFCSLLPLQPHSSEIPSVDGPGYLFPHISLCAHKQMRAGAAPVPPCRDADGDQTTLILLEHAFCP